MRIRSAPLRCSPSRAKYGESAALRRTSQFLEHADVWMMPVHPRARISPLGFRPRNARCICFFIRCDPRQPLALGAVFQPNLCNIDAKRSPWRWRPATSSVSGPATSGRTRCARLLVFQRPSADRADLAGLNVTGRLGPASRPFSNQGGRVDYQAEMKRDNHQGCVLGFR
jgi:hypothetical protein